ncbi:carbohydrate ABC transporter permease [Desulfuromonas sp. TF]|uniref:carbohydrate ABC transporter permease n=1 Tax=Desulfuromonas sp. TF TaxID=1232410 RepID=UPI00041DB5FB|nr:sugar ABC transporter permease [Desulfuromonas sp. TF]
MADTTLREYRKSIGYILPLVFLMVTLIVVPVLGTVLNSLYLDVTYLDRRFIGLENFQSLVFDSGFWQAVRFTLLFTLVSVPLEVILGLVFALVLNEPVRLRGLWRACILIPWAIPAVISGRIFELIYNYHYGLANFLFRQMGIVDAPVNWLGSPPGAFLSLVAADAWKTTPFAAIILLAGISGIPEELYRQARVDGANIVQRFFHITLPLLRPVLLVTLLFRTIDALRIFDVIYVLTGGGPGGATTSLSLYGYEYFLAGDFGYGSAVSVVLFLIAFSLAILYVRLSGYQKEIM